MKIRPLDRKVLSLAPDAGAFLNDYSSNVPGAPHAAFLDREGRIVVTFDQIRAGDAFLIAIEAPFLGRLRGHLAPYLDLTGVRLAEEPRFKVYFDLDAAAAAETGDYLIPQKKGRLLITTREIAATVSPEEFTLFRLKHAIPVQGVDYDREMLLNLGDDSCVSFTKGCFLGQEIVARVHHRGKPPKRLAVVGEGAGAPLTSKARDPETGRVLGFSFVPN